MTLKELKCKVGKPKGAIHYETLKGRENVFIQVATQHDAVITVYTSGHVLYQLGNRKTSFPITACGDYTYTFADGSSSTITEEEFDKGDWMIRVVLEGEKRIAQNLIKIEQNHGLGEEAILREQNSNTEEDFAIEDLFVDPRPNGEERMLLMEEQTFWESFFQSLVPRQKVFVKKFYVEGKNYHQIAKEMGCSLKAVRNINYRVLELLRWEWEHK